MGKGASTSSVQSNTLEATETDKIKKIDYVRGGKFDSIQNIKYKVKI